MEVNKVNYLNVSKVGTVKIDDLFWNRYFGHLQETTIPHIWEKATEGDALHLAKMAAGDIPMEEFPEDGKIRGRRNAEVTLIGWLEGALFSLAHKPNKQIQKWVDYAVDLLIRSQDEEGYFLSYYTLYEKEKRFKNLLQSHELVLMGDHIDAAVMYKQVTGKTNYLDAVSKMADYIYEKLGPNSPNPYLVDGHAGIEAALVKLYRETGNKKHLELAKHFIDVRGVDPDALQRQFEEEWKGESLFVDWHEFGDHKYMQIHQPVREQKTAEGHGVRALYLYTGMMDVYMETGDESLLEACKILYDNIVGKRMYISGGLGSCNKGERFTTDYDLPNTTMYAESCASVAMTFFCRRMFQSTREAKYLDTLELELYNVIPGAVSLDGKHFFYVNPLEVWPEASEHDITKRHIIPERWSWHKVPCCPPNILSAIAGLDGYMYYTEDDVLYVGLFISSETKQIVNGKEVGLKIETRYPFENEIRFGVDYDGEFTLAIRRPGWTEKVSITINGEPYEAEDINGMLHIRRNWKAGDTIVYTIDMPARLMVAHPQVRDNAGKAAICKGPLLYCLEEVDNGANLNAISIKSDVTFEEKYEPDLLGGTLTLHFKGLRIIEDGWKENELYKPYVRKEKPVDLVAIPYCLWQNRGRSEMLTWIRVY